MDKGLMREESVLVNSEIGNMENFEIDEEYR